MNMYSKAQAGIINHIVEEIYPSNPGGSLPYHNNTHMLQVCNIAFHCTYGELYDIDEIVLIIATLFHDYRHSGGKLKDSENVEIAISKAVKFCREFKFEKGVDIHIEYLVREVEDAIQCTEFPFIHEPKNLIQKALRDADILYAIMSKDPKVIMEGLRKELNDNRPEEDYINYRTMLEGQKEFFKQMKFYTHVGQSLFDAYGDEYLNILEKYVNQVESLETNTRSEFDKTYGGLKDGPTKDMLWTAYLKGYHTGFTRIE